MKELKQLFKTDFFIDDSDIRDTMLFKNLLIEIEEIVPDSKQISEYEACLSALETILVSSSKQFQMLL
jgi:hypothetical protein